MAEFIEVMKQGKRMCDSIDDTCCECGLSFVKNGKNIGCDDFVTYYPQEAEKIIMDWAKEHPIKTNADKFNEVFGYELPKSERDDCFGFECPQLDCSGCEHYTFWNREYVEPKKENEDGKID